MGNATECLCRLCGPESIRTEPHEAMALADYLPPTGPVVVARQADGHAEVIVRASPDQGQIVMKVPNGELMTVLDREGLFLKIHWNHNEGWVKGSNVEEAPRHIETAPARPAEPLLPRRAPAPTRAPVPSPAPGQAIGVAQQGEGHAEVVLRASPNRGAIVAKVPNGQEVVILERQDELLKVRWSNKEGWTKASNVLRQTEPQDPVGSPTPAPAPQQAPPPGQGTGVAQQAPAPAPQQAPPPGQGAGVAQQAPAPGQAMGVARQAEGHAEVIVRSSPNGGAIVAKVPNGQEVVILERGGELMKVRWNNKEGWTKANNVQHEQLPQTLPPAPTPAPAPQQAPPPTGVPQQAPAPGQAMGVARQADGHAEVIVRSSPHQGAIVAKVPNGQEVVILERGGELLKVRWNNKEGWTKANNVQHEQLPQTLPPAPTPAPQQAPPPTGVPQQAPAPGQAMGVARQAEGHAEVIVRSSPNGGAIVAKVPNGQEVVILERGGELMKVRWNNKEGWTKANNVQHEQLPQTLPPAPTPAPAPAPYVEAPAAPPVARATPTDAPEVLIIGTGIMGSRVAAWLLVLGERVRIWTTTNRNLKTTADACESAKAEVQRAVNSSDSAGFSISAGVAASMVAQGNSAILAALPFEQRGSLLQATEELWSRLTVQANDGRPGMPDSRSANNVWLAIDCTRDPTSIQEKSDAAQRAAKLFEKVRAESRDAVLAIKHEALEYSSVEAVCNPRLPVIRLRFLKPVFFVPFVELQGSDETSVSRVSQWLENYSLMPFKSATRVRMMQGSEVDAQATRLMRQYAAKRYTGATPESDICCVCLVSPAEVVNGTCGHSVFCAECAADYSQAGHRRCPLCRAPWRDDMALHLAAAPS